MIPRTAIDAVDHGQRGLRSGEPRGGRTIQADVVQELGELQLPRAIAPRVLPDCRLGRTHLREHSMERHTLETVAATKAVDRELAVAAVDLEREQVLPFRAADVQKGGGSL